jgi:16S rRNA processing protein RimM
VPGFVAVGRVGRPHGLDGAFVVERASDDERRYAVGARVFVDGEPATIVLSRRAGGRRRAVKLDRPVERGQELSVPREDLPPPDEGHFYVADLIGLEVVDEAGTSRGSVRDVRPGPANDALELSDGSLVPMIEDAILSVDLDASRVVVATIFLE